MIPESIKWSQLNLIQQKELMSCDAKKREVEREKKITSVLDDIYQDLSDYEDDQADNKLRKKPKNLIFKFSYFIQKLID